MCVYKAVYRKKRLYYKKYQKPENATMSDASIHLIEEEEEEELGVNHLIVEESEEAEEEEEEPQYEDPESMSIDTSGKS